MNSDFKIHTLGCGSARPSLLHQPSSTVVEHRGNLFMVDCGEGTQSAFMRQRLKFSRLSHIFLTHLHGDHIFGLPGLIGTLALSGIGGKITIHTFKEGVGILSTIFDFFNRDFPIEINFNIIEAEPKIIFENKALRVRTVPLKHRVKAVGYVFEEKEGLRHIIREMTDFHNVPVSQMNNIKHGEDFVKPDGTVVPNHVLTRPASPSRSYAHISDTAYSPAIADEIKGVTLLMHETTYLSDHLQEAGKRGHSTAAQAAQIAKLADVGTLLTGHYSSRYNNDELFRQEALEVFPNVITNREGLTVAINSDMTTSSSFHDKFQR